MLALAPVAPGKDESGTPQEAMPALNADFPQDSTDLAATAEAAFGFPLTSTQLAETRTWNTKNRQWWADPDREAAARTLLGELYSITGTDASLHDLQSAFKSSSRFFGVQLPAASGFVAVQNRPDSIEIVVDFNKRPDLASLHRGMLSTLLSFRESPEEIRYKLFGLMFPEVASSEGIAAENGQRVDLTPFEAAVESYVSDHEQRLDQRRQELVDSFYGFHVSLEGQQFTTAALEELELRGFQAEEEALVEATEAFLHSLPAVAGWSGEDLRRMLIDYVVEHRLAGGAMRIWLPTVESRNNQAAELAAAMMGA